MSLFRQNLHIWTSIGAGMVIGIMYWRMTNKILQELQQLSGAIAQLQAEVTLMKENIQQSSQKRKSRPGSGFITASSGDDDEDIFEEANDGGGSRMYGHFFDSGMDKSEEEILCIHDQGLKAAAFISDLESLKEIEEQILPSTPTISEAQKSRPDIFAEVDRLLEGLDDDKQKAFEILEKNRGYFLSDPDYHWRFAKTTFQLSQIFGAQGLADKKKEYIYNAKDLAENALRLDSQCANAHKWYAITIGSVGEFESTQDKIKNGFLYKEHIEKAISLNPDDPSNHHLLGRWCYSVYMLSWIERKAAAALFATPPTATAEEALDHFLKAQQLKPGKWKENILYIVKCCIELRKYKEVKMWLEAGLKLPVVSQDDKTSHAEMTSLLPKYQGY